MNVSVIVCTRNPRSGLLARLGEALRGQDANPAEWERVVVDNGSEPPVAAADFPGARLVREEEPGLTPARLRGIRESRGGLLIFFDDDNVPDPDYVSRAIALFRENQNLGVAGGRIDGEFGQDPPKWIQPYLGWLAVRPGVCRETVADRGDPWTRLPCGAGFCIRADAAKRYVERVEGDSRLRSFDRKGNRLTGSGDTDLALTALDIGYHARLTPRLRLRHMIPVSRLDPEYMERLLEGSAYSTVRLALMRGVPCKPAWMNRILRRLKRCLAGPASVRRLRLRMERAIDRGEAAARSEFACECGRDGE